MEVERQEGRNGEEGKDRSERKGEGEVQTLRLLVQLFAYSAVFKI